ncbi:MAG: DUF2293 domain-containing protein [Balneolaceae bacterium]|nr:MAG: DUF2293 domain-containing protein [Balneolaceae bacterium]
MVKKKSPGQTSDIVVFEITRDSECVECGEELGRGRLLRLEADRPLCLGCADLSRLVYVPRGDAALTRRASKYSKLRAIVLRFSRARKRYERQGILVEESALDRAERECLADTDARARLRERRAAREAIIDGEYRAEFGRRVQDRYPGCPPDEAEEIAEHACLKYSGRVGRTAAAKEFAAEALELAVRAHVRHRHSVYDELLSSGWDRYDARTKVAAQVDKMLKKWREP